MAQLWVGTTEIWESEEQLMNIVRQQTGIAPLACWFSRNKETGTLDGYGFIQFNNISDAATVLRLLQGAPIPNMPNAQFKLNWSSTKGSSDVNTIRQATGYSVYVGNLPISVNESRLLEFFRRYFHSVISARLIKGTDGISKGYGFVKFNTQKEVDDAIRLLNGSTEFGRGIKVSEATGNRVHMEPNKIDASNTTLIVQNIDPEIVKEETLFQHFKPYGNVLSVKFIPDHPDWANVTMETSVQAESAKNALQGTRFGGTTKCEIQFGRPSEDPLVTVPEVTVPVIKPPKVSKKFQAKFFNETGVDRVLDVIQRYAESNRDNTIINADPTISNRIYSQRISKENLLMECESYTDTIPSSIKSWYY
ncbi:polyadenylate-binding protein RBP45B isoform X2 [Histomonas meleagridis]|uniref:polyadenylate-binding protein RBP45B isoform X2 n=1 Tax=Histomonas meleagridis TaxID=135588 RepID=UPI00355ABA9F|nr:polyadenylate-binding protein RBP45B isoform X2 [Histomonas meleagridis]KAH0804345.1 polyadenylate-binding protein RBP45B isoform X2 [Histomonas meleagridis]